MAVYGCIWLRMAAYGCVYGFVWLCMAVYVEHVMCGVPSCSIMIRPVCFLLSLDENLQSSLDHVHGACIWLASF